MGLVFNIHESGYFYCTYPDGKKMYLHRLIMRDEIKRFIDRTGISSPVVDHINRQVCDNRRCNLRVVSKRINAINTIKGDNTKYYGVFTMPNYSTTTNTQSYRMKIPYPKKDELIQEYYTNEIDAALAYDYYVNKYYSWETDISNIGQGKIPQEELDKRGIKSIKDIDHRSFEANKREKHSTASNKFSYYGISEVYSGSNTIQARYLDPNTKKKYRIGDTVPISELLQLVARREYFIEEHPEFNCKSNVWYPPNPENKIVVAGIIVSREEQDELKKGTISKPRQMLESEWDLTFKNKN
ncbi:MAG: HNH endonuclease [Bacilli bacterium]|nr:HNH endonuclease [Bacilli bacterium]